MGPASIASLRALARLVGRSTTTVYKWTRHAKWIFPRRAPWAREDVRLIRAWAARYLSHSRSVREELVRPSEAGADDALSRIEQAKLAYLVERALYLRQQREKEAGTLHRTAECIALHASMVHRAKGALQGLGRAMRNSLVGLDADGIERAINERLAAILEEFERDE